MRPPDRVGADVAPPGRAARTGQQRPRRVERFRARRPTRSASSSSATPSRPAPTSSGRVDLQPDRRHAVGQVVTDRGVRPGRVGADVTLANVPAPFGDGAAHERRRSREPRSRPAQNGRSAAVYSGRTSMPASVVRVNARSGSSTDGPPGPAPRRPGHAIAPRWPAREAAPARGPSVGGRLGHTVFLHASVIARSDRQRHCPAVTAVHRGDGSARRYRAGVLPPETSGRRLHRRAGGHRTGRTHRHRAPRRRDRARLGLGAGGRGPRSRSPRSSRSPTWPASWPRPSPGTPGSSARSGWATRTCSPSSAAPTCTRGAGSTRSCTACASRPRPAAAPSC